MPTLVGKPPPIPISRHKSGDVSVNSVITPATPLTPQVSHTRYPMRPRTNSNSGSNPRSPRGARSPRGILSPPQQTTKIRCVGYYDLEKTLGRGRFGKAKLATHVLTGEKVAIKIIRKSKLNNESLELVRQEIKAMKNLSHPNIIQLYEVVETENVIFIIMEYSSGGEVSFLKNPKKYLYFPNQ
jgi:serine/threonine protein kinase